MLNKMNKIQTVVFTQRAFNAIVTETISKHPIETGGIFLGYILDNGTWIVVENIAPGFKSTHQAAYFEYDKDFVTYLANVIANQYKGNLRILGLWHRHPGDFDKFSSTDDETNRNYANDSEHGAISALVNCDPKFRLSMFHVSQNGEYHDAEWFVDEGDLIPQELLELYYTDVDNLPVFDRHGVIHPNNEKSSSTEDNVQVQEESMASPNNNIVTSNTYTLSMALHDIGKILINLSKGTTDEH